jgi:hypothetical protein
MSSCKIGSTAEGVQPWHRLPKESGIAYERFVIFRDLGPTRTIAAAARAVGKCPSLLYRWADRHQWWDRVLTFDLAQQRDQEMNARHRTQEAAERWVRYADRLERLGMAAMGGVVSRDPQTGESGIDPSVKVRDAVAIIKLVLQIHDRLAAVAPPPLDGNALESKLLNMSDAEIEEAVTLLERAQQNVRPGSQQRKEDDR